MKDWAPGMIIPRKKAASADDIARPTDGEDRDVAEDMWSKRSRELANAKQTKVLGNGATTSYLCFYKTCLDNNKKVSHSRRSPVNFYANSSGTKKSALSFLVLISY